MRFRLLFGFVAVVLPVMLMTNVMECECKAFGPLTQHSSVDELFEQASDVVTGKRDIKIHGNILDGDATITTSYTNEEIMTMVAIGGGILLALVCCGVCCKHCCCPNKAPTVIMYQQMPSGQLQHQIPGRAVIPGNNMIPMRNQEFNGVQSVQSHFTDTSPPPPYPGIVAT